jgi:hypothetical protein
MSNTLEPAGPAPFSAHIFCAGETAQVSTAEELSILAAAAQSHGWPWTVQHAVLIIAKAKDLETALAVVKVNERYWEEFWSEQPLRKEAQDLLARCRRARKSQHDA